MSYAGLNSLSIGIYLLDESNTDAQITKAYSVINDTVSIFHLQQAQLDLLRADAQEVFAKTLDLKNPVPAQIAQEKKNIHTSQSDVQMGIMTSVIESQKGESEILGGNMGQVYLLQQPIVELLKTVTHSLVRY